MLKDAGNYLVYLIFRLFIFLGGHLPMEPTFKVVRAIALIAYQFIPGYRRIAIRNLEIAFGDKLSPGERERICKEAFVNLVYSGAEMIFMDEINKNWQEHYTFEGAEPIDQHVRKKEPHFVFGGHFGGWMMLSMVGERYKKDNIHGATVMRHFPNKYIDKYVRDLAVSYNSRFLEIHKTGKQIEQLISEGAMVGFYMDQESRRHQGIQVDFFGLPAYSHVVPGYLAWKHHLPVYPFWYVRKKPGYFHIIYRKPIEMSYTGNKEYDIRVITQNITKEVERTISDHPEQWLWFHNRWKRTIGEDKQERKDRGSIKVDKDKYKTGAQVIEEMEEEIGEKKDERAATPT